MTKPLLDLNDFPMLAQFAAAYLHEDFVVEHKTPTCARDQFLADASAKERHVFLAELQRFREAADHLPWRDARAAFASLGGAWRPASRAALGTLLTVAAPPADTRKTRSRSGR